MKKWLFLLLALWIASGRAWAGEVDSLQVRWTHLAAVRDSLRAQRGALVDAVDRLSVRVDSLKRSVRPGPASGALQEALRRGLELTDRLDGVDRRLDGVDAEVRGLRGRLAEEYDREIGSLIERLTKAPDDRLLRRLAALQRARAALETARPEASDEGGTAGVRIRPGDGPDEIRQKADLLEDMAARLQARVLAVDHRVHDLEQERRLRARVAALDREAALFDENLPEGRTLAPGEKTGGPGRDGNQLTVSGSGPGVVAGQEVTPVGGNPSPEIGPGNLDVQIARLKAQGDTLRLREAAMRQEVAAFRNRILQMLRDGR